jgi:hypothetical protein
MNKTMINSNNFILLRAPVTDVVVVNVPEDNPISPFPSKPLLRPWDGSSVCIEQSDEYEVGFTCLPLIVQAVHHPDLTA